MQKRFLFVWLLCLCAAGALPALEVPDAPEGLALAAKLRAAVPTEDSQTRGVLKIETGGVSSEVPVVCEVKVLDGTWETIYQTGATSRSGAERLVVIHSSNGPNRYLYARASGPSAPLPEARPLAPGELSTPLAGSDFSLGELGLDFLHWPHQSRLKGEMRLGQPCYVLESNNPSGNPIRRIISYIDEASGGLLLAEGYDSQGRLVKEYSLHGSSFKKVNGQWRLEKMEMSDKIRHSRTTLKFDIQP